MSSESDDGGYLDATISTEIDTEIEDDFETDVSEEEEDEEVDEYIEDDLDEEEEAVMRSPSAKSASSERSDESEDKSDDDELAVFMAHHPMATPLSKEAELADLKQRLERAMRNSQWSLALQTCKRILEKTVFKFDGTYHFICGFIYETGFLNFEAAERHYRVALQIDGRNERYVRYYARASRRLGKYEDSAQMYLYGLELDAKNEDMRYEYAYLLWLWQKYPECLKQLRKCLKLAGVSPLEYDSKTQQSATKRNRRDMGRSLDRHNASISGDTGGDSEYTRLRRKTIRPVTLEMTSPGDSGREQEDESDEDDDEFDHTTDEEERAPKAKSGSGDGHESDGSQASGAFSALFGLASKKGSEAHSPSKKRKKRRSIGGSLELLKKAARGGGRKMVGAGRGGSPAEMLSSSEEGGGGDEGSSSEDDSHEACNENVYWLYGRVQCELEQYKVAEVYLVTAMHMKADDIGYMTDYILVLINGDRHMDALKEYMYARYISCGDGDLSNEQDRPSSSRPSLRLSLRSRDGQSPSEELSMSTSSLTGEELITLKTALQLKYRSLPIGKKNLFNHKRVLLSYNLVYLQSVFGYLLSCLGRLDEATDVFESLLEICEFDYYELHFYYALHLHYSCKDLSKALHHYIIALVIEKNWAIVTYHLCCVCYQLSLYECSLFWLSEAHDRNKHIPLVRSGYLAIGQRLTEKLKRIRKSSKSGTHPSSEEEFHSRAVRAYGAREWDMAAMLFLQLTLISPKNLNYHHNLAMVLQYGFKCLTGAETFFRSSIKCSSSSHPDILRHYAQLLVTQERFKEGASYYALLFKLVEEYNNSLSDDSSKKKSSKKRSRIELSQSDFVNYGLCLVELVDRGQDEQGNLGGTGILEAITKAIKYLKRAFEMKAEDWKCVWFLAKALCFNGEFDESGMAFEKAVKLNGNCAELRYDYASVQWHLQDYNGAQRSLNRCLKLTIAVTSKDSGDSSSSSADAVGGRAPGSLAKSTTSKSHSSSQAAKKADEAENKRIRLVEEKAYLLYGVILQDLERYDKAEKFIVQCLRLHQPRLRALFPRVLFELEPSEDDYSPALQLGRVHSRESRRSSAASTGTSSAVSIPDDITIDVKYIAELMLVKIRQRDLVNARHLYDFALQLVEHSAEPSDWYLDCVFAIWLSESGLTDEATHAFDTLVSSPQNINEPCYFIHYYFGLHLLYAAKQYGLAKVQFEEAMVIEDNWALCLWHYANACYRLADMGTAKMFALKASEICNGALPLISKQLDHFLAMCQSKMSDKFTPPSLGNHRSASGGDGKHSIELRMPSMKTPSKSTESAVVITPGSHRGVSSVDASTEAAVKRMKDRTGKTKKRTQLHSSAASGGSLSRQTSGERGTKVSPHAVHREKDRARVSSRKRSNDVSVITDSEDPSIQKSKKRSSSKKKSASRLTSDDPSLTHHRSKSSSRKDGPADETPLMSKSHRSARSSELAASGGRRSRRTGDRTLASISEREARRQAYLETEAQLRSKHKTRTDSKTITRPKPVVGSVSAMSSSSKAKRARHKKVTSDITTLKRKSSGGSGGRRSSGSSNEGTRQHHRRAKTSIRR